MIRVFAAFLMAFLFSTPVARAQSLNQTTAQDVVWVQIEAHPSLVTAQQRAQDFAGQLADVNGFSLGGSWYGIVLGPYTREDANRVLRIYRSEGQIPADSFIAYSRNLGRQFWPDGADTLNRGTVVAPALPTEPATETAAAPEAQTEPADETPAEARRSERLLSAEERRGLQIALRSEGLYSAAIDGAFGPGTRRSMADWQLYNGFEQTGVLTTAQRKILMDRYNAPLISSGVDTVWDSKAGIEMKLPTKAVKFTRYEPPFAHYESNEIPEARVLLISQPGNRSTLYGLYEIMQTLEIVPLEGPRERGKDSFVLEGRGNGIVSYTQAKLDDGVIKGFTLVWPAGDEDRRARVLEEMKASFTRTENVLDPAAGTDAEQSIDLISGLTVRKPRYSRSGFFVDRSGTVLTSTQAVQSCTRITLDRDHQAELVSSDEGLGVAVLRPVGSLAPMEIGALSQSAPRLQSELAVSGFSYEGILGAPTLTFGTLSDVKGLRGETELSRLALAAQPGDAGGPVLDTGGNVVGMLLADLDSSQSLPRNVSFAANAQALRNVLEAAGLSSGSEADSDAVSPAVLNRIASGMTVLVSCWD